MERASTLAVGCLSDCLNRTRVAGQCGYPCPIGQAMVGCVSRRGAVSGTGSVQWWRVTGIAPKGGDTRDWDDDS